MFKLAFLSAVMVLVCACGGGIRSYEDGARAQAKIMKEMVSVLETVEDEASANKAASKIEDLGTQLTELSKQIAKLPRPSHEELQKISQNMGTEQQEFQKEAMPQMMKLAKYPVLSQAWSRAMANVHQ